MCAAREGSVCKRRKSPVSLVLDIGSDPKKRVVTTEGDSKTGLLTTEDLAMLQLTSPELEQIMLEPLNDAVPSWGGITQGSVQRDGSDRSGSAQQLSSKTVSSHPTTSHDSEELEHNRLGYPLASQGAQFGIEIPSIYHYPENSISGTSHCINAPLFSTTKGFTDLQTTGLTSLEHFDSRIGSTTTDSEPSSSRTTQVIPTAIGPGLSYLPDAIHYRLFQSDEPFQIVPRLDSTSPDNIEVDDRLKLEQKREKNRMAARKCREKKMEHIVQLEYRVEDLKEQNRALSETATALRRQMSLLEAQVAQHLQSGCEVTTTNATTMYMNNS